MEGIDLRKYQKEGEDKEQIKNILGQILSGRSGYQTVIDDAKPSPKCACGFGLEGQEKFCPECGKNLVCGVKNCEIE